MLRSQSAVVTVQGKGKDENGDTRATVEGRPYKDGNTRKFKIVFRPKFYILHSTFYILNYSEFQILHSTLYILHSPPVRISR